MTKNNVIIVGAGVAGKELVLQLKKYFPKKYNVVGFLDDREKLKGTRLKEVEVLGKISDLSKFIKKFDVKEVFIAIPSANGELIRKVIEKCRKEKVIFKIVPRILEIVQGKVKISKIREIQPEDLLGRAIVKSDQKILKEQFRGKTILVTGGAGSIGSELCRQLIQFPIKKLYVIDSWESGIYDLDLELKNIEDKKKFECIVSDIRDYKILQSLMKRMKPDYIFHAAAYKHVPLMQLYPGEAVRTNIFGTYNLAKLAMENNVLRFVNISTDKAADPINVMGTTKLIAEKIVSELNNKKATKFCSVRFGNVLGSQGSVIPTFNKQISKGGPLTVTNKNMVRYFMSIPEAAQLVLNACLLTDRGGEIFVLDMGEPVKIDELARIMIRLAGLIPDEDIEIKYTGIRSGEKLKEKLFGKNEGRMLTNNPKIFRVKNGQDSLNIENLLEDLGKVADDNRKILGQLRKFAPKL